MSGPSASDHFDGQRFFNPSGASGQPFRRVPQLLHFGTFQLTPEPIDAPQAALAEARGARQVPEERFRALESGESLLA